MINESAARAMHIGVGSVIALRGYRPSQAEQVFSGANVPPRVRLPSVRVVGILRLPRDLATNADVPADVSYQGNGAVYLNAAFYQAVHRKVASDLGLAFQLRRGDAGLPAVRGPGQGHLPRPGPGQPGQRRHRRRGRRPARHHPAGAGAGPVRRAGRSGAAGHRGPGPVPAGLGQFHGLHRAARARLLPRPVVRDGAGPARADQRGRDGAGGAGRLGAVRADPDRAGPPGRGVARAGVQRRDPARRGGGAGRGAHRAGGGDRLAGGPAARRARPGRRGRAAAGLAGPPVGGPPPASPAGGGRPAARLRAGPGRRRGAGPARR